MYIILIIIIRDVEKVGVSTPPSKIWGDGYNPFDKGLQPLVQPTPNTDKKVPR